MDDSERQELNESMRHYRLQGLSDKGIHTNFLGQHCNSLDLTDSIAGILPAYSSAYWGDVEHVDNMLGFFVCSVIS